MESNHHIRHSGCQRQHPLTRVNPPGKYCPFYLRVISTVPHFLASGGQTEDGGIEPLRLPAPWFSRPVAVPSAASSPDNNGSWRSRTPTNSIALLLSRQVAVLLAAASASGCLTGLEPVMTCSTNKRRDRFGFRHHQSQTDRE